MRSARYLVGAWLLLGGMAACSDHNPTVVFTVDAAAKSEAGPAQDVGESYDGRPVAEVAVDLTPDANPITDVANALDAGVDWAIDLNNQAVDGSSALDVGFDSSAAYDGSRAGG